MSDVTLFLGTSKLTPRIAVRPLNVTATSLNRMEMGPDRGLPFWPDIPVDTVAMVMGSTTSASPFVARPQTGGSPDL